MKRVWSPVFSIALVLAFVLSFLPGQTQIAFAAPVPLTDPSIPYTQNFDSLANSGSSALWANDSTLPGWYLGTDANATVSSYLVGTGSGTAGGLYSYGSSGSTDRALGGLGSNTFYGASGVGKAYIGLVLQNQTGANISTLNITYTGEQWRNGGNATIQSLTFSYVISSSVPALTAAGTSIPTLDFASPIHTTTAAALDGNNPANRAAALTGSITNVVIPNGYYILLRWTDLNDAGNDHGLAIDDLSVAVSTLPLDAAPTVASTVPADGATEVPLNSSVTVTFSEPVNVAGSWFSLACDGSGMHDATVTGGPTTFTIDPGTDFVLNDHCTLTIYAANVTDQDNNDPPDNMSVNFTAGFGAVTAPLPIGTVNGPVNNGDIGPAHASPYNGQVVKVQGVIYELTQQAISNSSNHYNGFFLQSTADTTDGEPNTSDGLFVFMSTKTTINGPSGPYTPAVGDDIILTGKVSEFFNMTELVAPSSSIPLAVQQIVRSGVDVNAEVSPTEANPPSNINDANRYWERLQGMRLSVPSGSLTLGGRNVFSPADAEIWLARPDSVVAARSDSYQRRAFRDAHPLDDNFNAASWDGNGYRILIGSLGIKALANDSQALIVPARSFSTLSAPVSGGLNYTFSKYRIEVDAQPSFNEGVDPSQNNPPQAFDRTGQYSIADYNVENLYDFRDNPFSGCDFANDPPGSNPKCLNTGTPFLANVNPPYDYVPASDAVYQQRLGDIATQIIQDLHSPDILMVQEVENQDICSVSGGALVCGSVDNADGKPDDLQELALRIASLGGPVYDAAFDRDSSDLRGIVPSFLYRTDRVELRPAAGDPVLGANPAIAGYTSVPYNADVSNPKTLNAILPAGITACETSWVFPRAPDIALFRVYQSTVGSGPYRDVYAINNHFKSGPDTCVGHRTEQARFNAALVSFIQAASPQASIVLGGDLNVYPRPDDPFAPIGQSGSSDQLGSLYNPALGLKNLWEVELADVPASAYSYVFVGQAQTIDQMLVNQPMFSHLAQYRTAHINSDWPAEFGGDVARGTSDHDPSVARFQFALPPVVAAPMTSPEPSGEGHTATAGATFTSDAPAGATFTCTVDYGDGIGAQAGSVSSGACTGPAHTYSTYGTYTVTVTVNDSFGNTASKSSTHRVIFNFTGFFQPVDNMPVLNLAKVGSAIPVKFALGGDKGLGIMAAGYPKATLVACDNSEPVDAIESTVTAGSSGLQYDPSTQTYTYVWKTDNTWAGTCRQLSVRFVDGATYIAQFKFK